MQVRIAEWTMYIMTYAFEEFLMVKYEIKRLILILCVGFAA